MKISFELLPAKTADEMPQLLEITEQLSAVKPAFISVASEISATPAQATIDAVTFLQKKYSVPLVPHITASNKTKNDIKVILDQYLQLGIKRCVVLRGNVLGKSDFKYASELVVFIRDYIENQLAITVAIDPNDSVYFKQKVEAGADGAITQFFYDITVYEQLLESCQQQKINIPIIPGILPILEAEKTMRLAKQCGVTLPKHIVLGLEKFANDQHATLEFGIEVVIRLCQQLLAMGVPGLHFFTLNQSAAVLKILKELNYEN